MKSKELLVWGIGLAAVVGAGFYAQYNEAKKAQATAAEQEQVETLLNGLDEQVMDLGSLYDDLDLSFDGDYTDLSADEQAELVSIYERYTEIYEDIYSDTDEEAVKEKTEKYKDELNQLADQILEYEVNSGIYGELTKDEVIKLNDLYEQEDQIYDDAAASDDEEAYLTSKQSELDKLDDQILELSIKAGYYGELTKDEVIKLNDLYEQENQIYNDAAASEDEEAYLTSKQSELDKLAEQILELEVKAGYYGELTVDEVNELEDLYQQREDIYAAAYGEDYSNSDEEVEAYLKKNQSKLDTIEDKIIELEVKAGYYGELTADEVKELNDLYDQYISTDDESELEEIEARISELEAKE